MRSRRLHNDPGGDNFGKDVLHKLNDRDGKEISRHIAALDVGVTGSQEASDSKVWFCFFQSKKFG